MKPRSVLATAVCVGCAIVLILARAGAQSGEAKALSPVEQRAVATIRAWNAGWEARDPNQVAAQMTEDAFWSGGFPNNPDAGIWRTSDRYLQQDGGATRSGVKFTVAEELVISGSAGTAVLHRRMDEFGFGPYGFGAGRGGPGTLFMNAVLFWVNPNDKIQVWLDGPVSRGGPRTQAPPLDNWAADERAALEVVKGFVAAWNARDADKVASYMNDDVLVSTYFPRNISETGRAHFLDAHRRNITQGVEMRIDASLAVGGDRGMAVLIKRVDRFSVGGRQREVPNAGYFWLTNGKIHTWLDLPLEPPPNGADGAPVIR